MAYCPPRSASTLQVHSQGGLVGSDKPPEEVKVYYFELKGPLYIERVQLAVTHLCTVVYLFSFFRLEQDSYLESLAVESGCACEHIIMF